MFLFLKKRTYPLLTYLHEKGENFGQNIWDTKCGAIGNILRNTLKTWGNATHKETN
jgi:hypothetical protein